MSQEITANVAEEQLAKNPLLQFDKTLPDFEAIQAEHILPAVSKTLENLIRKFEELEKNHQPTWEGLMLPLNELEQPLNQVWNPISHLYSVRSTEEFRKDYDIAKEKIVEAGLRMSQSQAIYKGMKAIQNGPEWEKLSEAQKRILKQKIQSVELSGIALAGEEQKRFNDIQMELSRLKSQFSNHVLDSIKSYELILQDKEEIQGLPNGYLSTLANAYNEKFPKTEKKATAEDGPWLVGIDRTSAVPFLQNAVRRDLREKLYRAMVNTASQEPYDNSQVIRKILKLHQEEAMLLGFSSYAEMSLSMKMAPGLDAVYQLLHELDEAAKPFAKKELAELQNFAEKEFDFQGQIQPWDLHFYSQKFKHKLFDFDDELMRKYFSLPNVLRGMFDLVKLVFGIDVKEETGDTPIWHKDVRFFKVYDGTNHIASFYLDPYSRPENKQGGAWMNDFVMRRRHQEQLRLPVAILVTNFTPPLEKNKPARLTFEEVSTLFHEFGHGLQHMLTTVDLDDVSGVNGVEWDAVEIASQFMENWLYHKETLIGMTAHVDDGSPMPDDLFDKILQARTFQAGTLMLRQLLFGLTDLELFHRYDPNGSESPYEVYKRIARDVAVLQPIEEDHFLNSFGHIFAGAYAAGYYSYKWAEVMSADLFSAFENHLNDKEQIAQIGRRLRQTLYALGGSREPLQVFQDFMGRTYSTEALLRHSGLVK